MNTVRPVYNSLVNWLVEYSGENMHITKREKQVIKLLCDGVKPGEIAISLGISANTVKRHSTNIRHKFKVRGQCGIVSAVLLPVNSPLRKNLYLV